MPRTLLAVSLLVAAPAFLPAQSLEQALAAVTATGAYASVERLSGAEFAGRLTGTDGYRAAAEWTAAELARAGFEPVPGGEGFLHPFPVALAGIERARMAVVPAAGAGEPRELKQLEDYLPLLFSGSGSARAEVVFVGLGMTAPELGRDDYAGLEVRGKIVMALRGRPDDGRDWSGHDSHRARTRNAAAHGAAGYLFAESAIANPNGEQIEGLPMASISTAVADELLSASGLKVEQLHRVLERGGSSSFPTGRTVVLEVVARPTRAARGFNVLARLPGSDPALAREPVVLGAHLDHCGDWPVLLPGADDNASGAATVLEIARAAALAPRPRRPLVVALFGGEEMGLLGSRDLVAKLDVLLGRPVGLLNLDMVGAGTGAFVAAGKSFPALLAAIESARDRQAPGMAVRSGLAKGEARADHGPFLEVGVPAVSIFGMGGNHHGYHTGEDTIWWITPRTMEAIGRVVLDAALSLADAR